MSLFYVCSRRVTMCAVFRVSWRQLSQRRQLSYSTGKTNLYLRFLIVCLHVQMCVHERDKEKADGVLVMQLAFLYASTLVASMWSCNESMKRSPTGSQASLTPSACSMATASSSIAAWIWSRRSKVLSMCLVGNIIHYI